MKQMNKNANEHSAEASLTVFISERERGAVGGGADYKNSLFQCFVTLCNVL